MVLRYLTVVLLVVSFFLYFTAPGDLVHMPWSHYNETALRIESQNLRLLTNTTQPPGNMTASELYQYVQNMKKSLPVNPHNFHRIINPTHICHNLDVFLLVYVHTSPDHFKHRMIIRTTWGNPSYFADVTVRPVFLMGTPKDVDTQEAVMYESSQYHDILQEDFVDSYKNLTFKAIMALKWITDHCSHAKFVLKTDDDIFVNMFNLISHFKSWENHGKQVEKLLYCLVWTRMKVMRDPKSKWYISKEEFADDYFPTYCSGSAYMFSTDVIIDMYKASLDTGFFWVDDFYITGMLAAKVGVQHQKFNSVYVLGPSTFLEKFTEEPKWRTLVFGHVHNMNAILQVWQTILNER